MRKLLQTILFFAITLMFFNTKAQVTGIKNIPSDYATIQAAVADLNLQGVGAGGATINIPAGTVETATASIVLTMTSNPSTQANPLVFRKTGAGLNPLITAFSPGVSTTIDGIFILNGVDYVTIDGIDLQENVLNTTATMQMEWGYALVKASTINGAQFNTIKNCSVTLTNANVASVGIYIGNHLVSNNTALTITNIGGTSSGNKFFNNSIQNCYQGYSFTGYAAGAPYDFYDQNNQIGVDGVSSRRSQVVKFGGAVTAVNGIFATNQNGIKIFSTYINNNGAPASTGVMNGVSLVTGINSNVDVFNDTITLSLSGTTSQLTGINNAMGGTGAGNTINIYNNVIDGCTYATNTSGIFRGIQHSSTASYHNIYGNKIINNSIPGTGEFSAIYDNGSSATLVLATKIYSNTINNNTKTGTSGIFYCIYASGSNNLTECYSNIISNNSNSASISGTYGYYNFAFGLNENIYNNTLFNLTGGSGETIGLHVRSGSGPTNKKVYDNTVYNISGNSSSGMVGAIWVEYGTINEVYRNNIYNIVNNTATGLTPAAFGLNLGTSNNVQNAIYNNLISEIKAPSASNINAVYGIWLQGSATSVFNLYYNSVYLDAVSTGLNFGTAALAIATTPFSTDIRNNILINKSTPAGTGITRALLRGTNILTNYNTLSGYNCLYAGTPGPSNLIYADGTNAIQTLQAFKNLVGPREQASFSSIPPFVNTSSSPYNLHLQTSIATQCESGGIAISGFSTDYDNNSRNAITPDVGADEITGLTVDIASPDIQYVPLSNSPVAATKNVVNFATITDPSGINTTTGTKPRLYYKKSTHANTYISNLSSDDCWKYVEASNASSPFTFNINYSLMFGGGGVVAGDVIQYFVTAQDLNSTPNVGLNNGGFATQPANVNLAAANFPLGNTINQYTIVANAYTGTLNVGPTETVTSLTNVGGMFDLINNGVLTGNVTLNITGDLLLETGVVALNQWAEDGAGNYSLTIAPSAAVTRSIVGNHTTLSLVRFNGADRVNIDGRFNNAGTFLLFRNTATSAPGVGYINDAQNNTLQYSIIESGNINTSITQGGAVFIGSTTGNNGNDNITISNCEIRDRTDVAGTPAFAINAVGNNGTLSQYNNNVVIKNNNIHDWYLINSTSYGINVGVGNTNFQIDNNSFYQTVARTNAVSGASMRAINVSFAAPVNSNGGYTVTNNYVGGTAPLAAGNDMTLTVTGVGVSQNFIGMIFTTGQIPNYIEGNVFRKIDFTTNSPAAAATVWNPIQVANGIYSIGTLTGNVIGSSSSNGSLKITINSGGAVNSFLAGIFAGAANGYMSISNNTIGGINIAGNSTTGGIIPQWIQNQGTPIQNTNITNNLIGSTTVPNSISNSVNAAIVSFGIRHLITSGAGLTAVSNTIQNITDNSTVTTSANYGMLMIGTVGPQGPLNVSNNTIKNLSANMLPATPVLANIGISFQGLAGNTHTVDGNTISGISCSNIGAGAGYAVGIQTQGNSFGGSMQKNYINNITNNNTGTTPGVAGMYFSSGLNWNVNNNMISLSNSTNTNNIDLTGITDGIGNGGSLNLNYNSIYIGGNASTGINNSYAFNRFGSENVSSRNNIFYNERAGSTATHAAVSNSTPQGWLSTSSNYNAFITSDTTKLAVWSGTVTNFNAWKSNSLGDNNSNKNISSVITSTNLFVNTSTGDLHINVSTYPGGLATPIAITTDIDNNARSATFPAVGADEITCPSPVVSVTSQSNVTCFGGNNGLAAVTATGGATFSYSWSPLSSTLTSVSSLTAGVYLVNVTNNCSLTTTQTITITQPSSITPNSTQTNVSCFGGSNGIANLSPTGGSGPYTYSWSPVTSTVSSVNTLTAGVYSFTITDNNGCTGTNSVTITQPSSITTIGSSTAACTTQTNGMISATVTGGTPSYTYNWTPAVSTSSNAVNLLPGTYTLSVTDANSCTMTPIVFIVGSIPGPTVSISTTTNFICAGQAVTLTASGANSYSWSTSGTTSVEVVGPTSTTSYTVVGTAVNGCQGNAVTTISVSACTSIAKLNNGGTSVSIYPNPGKGTFFVTYDGTTDKHVEVYNSLNQLILSKSVSGQLTEVNIENQANGIYFVRLVTKEGSIESVSKIIKE